MENFLKKYKVNLIFFGVCALISLVFYLLTNDGDASAFAFAPLSALFGALALKVLFDQEYNNNEEV